MAIYCNQCLYFTVVIICLNIIVINSAPSDPAVTDLTGKNFFQTIIYFVQVNSIFQKTVLQMLSID